MYLIAIKTSFLHLEPIFFGSISKISPRCDGNIWKVLGTNFFTLAPHGIIGCSGARLHFFLSKPRLWSELMIGAWSKSAVHSWIIDFGK